MPCDQHRLEPFAREDAYDLHHGKLSRGQLPQQPVLAPGELVRQLLQRVDRPVVVDEAHDAAADPAHDAHEALGFPLLERVRPGQVEEVRMARSCLQLEARSPIGVVPRVESSCIAE